MTVDGVACEAAEGDTIAAALLRRGVRAWRRTPGGEPRGLFCGIGVCFDCTVTVDGERHVRACVTPVRPAMDVDTALIGNPE
jgi:aerobic-type carbon monoxide dehydrogenase small subunit (CoxS/CutS family)